MDKIKWYGVSARNTFTDNENTVAYQTLYKQMESLGGIKEDIIIDIVRTDSPFRPKLQTLIDTLGVGDRIELNTIDTLLQGDNRKAVDYYTAIIKKGINLVVYDFTGAVAKFSPFANVAFGDVQGGEPFLIHSSASDEELISAFKQYYNENADKKTTTAIKADERVELSDAFKEIYFAYESYQIDLPTTLTLMKEYCGLGNKRTFWAMAKDYENTLYYDFDLEIFSYQTPEILDLPKRCGGVPKEYVQILKCADSLPANLDENERINRAMLMLGMFGSYNVFRRWELLSEKKPKPRKPVLLDFNISDFKKRYIPVEPDTNRPQ